VIAGTFPLGLLSGCLLALRNQSQGRSNIGGKGGSGFPDRFLDMRKLIVAILLAFTLIGAPVVSNALIGVPPPAVQKGGEPDVKVWVNTGSGVYHCPGTRWYGNTKQGEYMTQKQAQDKGYRPAYGKVCE